MCRPIRSLGIRLGGLAPADVPDMDGRELTWQEALFAGIAVFVEATVCSTEATMVRARGRAGEGCCPSCGRPSFRVHDRYRRRLQDVPLAAREVCIVPEVRRFVCANVQCAQRTFAELALTVVDGPTCQSAVAPPALARR
ncbi:transposase family protein [Streptomyces sp. NPDC000851]